MMIFIVLSRFHAIHKYSTPHAIILHTAIQGIYSYASARYKHSAVYRLI